MLIAEREAAGVPAREFMQRYKAALPKYETISIYVDPFERVKQ